MRHTIHRYANLLLLKMQQLWQDMNMAVQGVGEDGYSFSDFVIALVRMTFFENCMQSKPVF